MSIAVKRVLLGIGITGRPNRGTRILAIACMYVHVGVSFSGGEGSTAWQ